MVIYVLFNFSPSYVMLYIFANIYFIKLLVK